MNVSEASDVQAVLALLDKHVDPTQISAVTRTAAFRLASQSSERLSAGCLTSRTLWAEHQPLEESTS